MSAGKRSLIALGALVGVSAATVLVLDLESPAPEIPAEPVVEMASLASLAIGPEDFGVAAPLDVRPTTLKRRETLSDVVNRL
eukprot:CAMPEP_0195319224 /NCGR_PEP_ID=MMETSP0708-20121125/5371_1 /TAXON_ID=33640 /ORGANISM="Asterionellopsis glacialis, Strain CCMP134" /LENGTH=81 /DNA_ID=CAMNT_0040385383 /DNA_START=71 /DNA_END=313 /DNA_ORIENTATION=-